MALRDWLLLRPGATDFGLWPPLKEVPQGALIVEGARVASNEVPLPPSTLILTQLQRRNHTTAEFLLTEGLELLRDDEVPGILTAALVARFGAEAAERIGERVGRLGHLAARNEAREA